MTLGELIEIKKDKTGLKVLRKWIQGRVELTDIQCAKVLSTTLTHALIECEYAVSPEEALELALSMNVDVLASMLTDLINGEITKEEVKVRITELANHKGK